MIEYISIDPGSKSTGWVEWSSTGEMLECIELNEDALIDKLDSLPVSVETIIVEEYRVYGHLATAHIGSKVETAQVIGAIKYAARRNKIRVIEQRSDVKGIAALWSGTKVPKGHMPDWLAAYLHGYFYLHKAGIIKARVLDDK